MSPSLHQRMHTRITPLFIDSATYCSVHPRVQPIIPPMECEPQELQYQGLAPRNAHRLPVSSSGTKYTNT